MPKAIPVPTNETDTAELPPVVPATDTPPVTDTPPAEVAPTAKAVGDYVKPTPAKEFNPAALTKSLTGLEAAQARNEYVKACELADQVNADLGGGDPGEAAENVAKSNLNPDLQEKLIVLVRDLVPAANYQFCGNIKASRMDLSAVPRCRKAISDVLALLR